MFFNDRLDLYGPERFDRVVFATVRNCQNERVKPVGWLVLPYETCCLQRPEIFYTCGPSFLKLFVFLITLMHDASSSPSSSPSSGSDPGLVVDVYHRVFHSRLKTFFSKCFPPQPSIPCWGWSGILTTWCLAISGSVDECGRKPAQLAFRCTVVYRVGQKNGLFFESLKLLYMLT